MKHHTLLFVSAVFVIAPVFGAFSAVSKCSKTNMQRCLDSGCAINVGMNPAARCQYCGTSAAGDIPSQKGISSVTVGQSTKNTLTDKELRVAPSDPGKRYMWVTTECIKKLPDCTTEDVSSIYDKLIEQSCKAAGITMQISKTMQNANKKRTKSSCNTDMSTCIDKKCGVAFENCEEDAVFTRSISECATDATGCDDYIAEFRTQITKDRKTTYAQREAVVEALVKDYQSTREAKLSGTQKNCQNGTTFNSCVSLVCSENMPNKCDENKTERSMAERLCQYYKTACTVLN